MYQNAGLVDHRDVEGAPVFKEGEIEEPVVDGKVMICRA